MEQLSIFDFIDYKEEVITLPPILKNLVADLKKTFDFNENDVEYDTWEHVPNLGKRLWISVPNPPMDWDAEKIISDYAKQNVEVSFSLTPQISDIPAYIYITTMWLTKGHKEVA